MLSRLLLWMLFISLTPAGPELVAWGVHYEQDGDFADRPDAEHRGAPDDQQEHGCAVLGHSCGCHGPTAPVREMSRSERVLGPPRSVHWPGVDPFQKRAPPQPVPPPPIS